MPEQSSLVPRFDLAFNLGHVLIVASSIASFAYGYARLEARGERTQEALLHEVGRREELGRATAAALADAQQRQAGALRRCAGRRTPTWSGSRRRCATSAPTSAASRTA